MHSPSLEPVFFEIANPTIFRIGLKPANVVSFKGDTAAAAEPLLKRFQYVVIGDETDRIGITAPFDEENTDLIFKIDDGAGRTRLPIGD